jgi:hypothetical protein
MARFWWERIRETIKTKLTMHIYEGKVDGRNALIGKPPEAGKPLCYVRLPEEYQLMRTISDGIVGALCLKTGNVIELDFEPLPEGSEWKIAEQSIRFPGDGMRPDQESFLLERDRQHNLHRELKG